MLVKPWETRQPTRNFALAMTPQPAFYTLRFPATNWKTVAVDPQQSLSTQLTLHNSPILFGCRTGICGTCLVSAIGNMVPPDAAEQEVLEILAPHCSTARLACQIQPLGDLSLSTLIP